ncbi:MAG TPA: UvrD-helicase domain-containing protein [Actinomycetota bacterium]|nr:UvrD-helicase domain-containing protein [Actinomycetota bacterium]
MGDPSYDLNPVQREAVEHGEGPVLVVAGAGSGKTRVLTHRIAHLIANGTSPFAIIAITFTNKAAGEMKRRVAELVGPVAHNMWVSTFHSACVRILRREAKRLGYTSSFSIYDTADGERLVKACLDELNLDAKKTPPRAVLATISDAKNRLVDAGIFSDFASNPWEKTVAKVYVEYQRRLEEAGAFDFDDLIMRVVEIFDRHPDVLAHYQNRFRHVLVDEYQDTNHAQARLATLLAGKWRNIFVVGDADQGIYAFRGATIRNLLDFERDWPDGRLITLEQNYRSTQTILDAANAVIENNVMRKPKELWTQSVAGEPITRYHAQNADDEAEWVADEIVRLRERGCPLSDMAIFYRTNAQSRVLEEVLAGRNVPYRVIGGVRFYERKEVKDILAWLRAAANPLDAVSVERAAQSPKRGIGDTSLARLATFARDEGIGLGDALARAEEAPGVSKRALGGMLEMSRLLGDIRVAGARGGVRVADVVELAWTVSGYMDALAKEGTFEALSRQENLRELRGVAAEYDEAATEPSLTGFLEEIALVTDTDLVDGEETGVSLMTLHNAKGLEFPVVFMIGMEEGVFPHIRALAEQEELEEERRLCYVGITRAKRRLYLLNAWSRMLFGQLNYNPPSRFLKEVPEQLVRMAERSEPAPSATRGPRGRTRAARAVADPESWRVGQEVVHERWGRGTILDISRSRIGIEATVNFPDAGGEKRLDLTLAPLQPG